MNHRSFMHCVVGLPLGLLVVAMMLGKIQICAAQEIGPQQPWSSYKVHDMDRPKPPVVAPATAPSETVKPPSDAIVLFDGSDLSKWEAENGGAPTWRLGDGAMTVSGRGGIRTREKFGDVQLHIEWATPTPPRGTSQGRGNSGVFLMSLYEIQVLDNYQADTYPDGQAGSVYGQYPPLVNASRAPGEWQTYDIFFSKAIYKDKKLSRPARITVLHNGVLVQANTEMFGPTVHLQVAKYPDEPLPDAGALTLQNHNNPVRFRNIWIRPLEKLQVQQEGKK